MAGWVGCEWFAVINFWACGCSDAPQLRNLAFSGEMRLLPPPPLETSYFPFQVSSKRGNPHFTVSPLSPNTVGSLGRNSSWSREDRSATLTLRLPTRPPGMNLSPFLAFIFGSKFSWYVFKKVSLNRTDRNWHLPYLLRSPKFCEFSICTRHVTPQNWWIQNDELSVRHRREWLKTKLTNFKKRWWRAIRLVKVTNKIRHILVKLRVWNRIFRF